MQGAKPMRLIVPILLAIVVHGAAVGHGFLNFDDNAYFTENPFVTGGLTLRNAQWAFGIHGPSMWIPVTWLSHQAAVSLFGAHSPMPHHTLNVLLHIINVVLVFGVISRVSKTPATAFWVACLFAVHPIHVESVSWLTERKDVLAGSFFWATLYVYLRRPTGIKNVLLWNTLGVLALLSKPSTVTLPCILILVDFFITRTPSVRGVLTKVPLCIAVALSSWMTVLCQQSINAISDGQVASTGLRIGNVVEAYATYLRKLVMPFDLVVPVPYRFSWDPLMVALSALLLVIISMWILYRRSALAGFCGLFYLGVLVPMIGLVQAGGQWIADRYMYLPAVAIYLLVISRLPLHTRPTRLVLGIAVAAITFCGIRQTQHWHSSETLFQHTISVDTKSYLAHNNLGLVYQQRGDSARAQHHYRQSLKAHPGYPEVLNNMAILLISDGRRVEAMTYLQRAYAVAPENAKTLHNIGRFWLDSNPQRALPWLRSATQCAPSFTDAFYNLGYAYLVLGAFEDAAHQFETTLRLAPDHANAAHNLSISRRRAAARTPQRPLPWTEFKQRLKDQSPAMAAPQILAWSASHTNAWDLYAAANKLRASHHDSAAVVYERALSLRPDFPEALNNYGVWLAGKGRIDEAHTLFARALALAPDYTDAARNLRAAEAQRR